MVIFLERGADLHMAQLMPLPLTVSCFGKIQIGFPVLVPARRQMCVCVSVCVCVLTTLNTVSLSVATLGLTHFSYPVVNIACVLLVLYGKLGWQ